MSQPIATINLSQDGPTSEETWDLVVLLNRELRSTKLKLGSLLTDVDRLQGENEALSARLQENSGGTRLTHCVAGSCKSADEVNSLKQAKMELESALVKSQTTCTEQEISIKSLKVEFEDTCEQNKLHQLHITTLQNEVSKLKDDLLSQTSQPASGNASDVNNPRFIPAELRPVLARFPPPDISDRPKASRPCALYRSKGEPNISPVNGTFVIDSEVIVDQATWDIVTSTHASPIMYCGNRFFWCLEEYQHAFFLIPSRLYDALDENPWRRNQSLSKLEDERCEVLYSAASPTGRVEVHYAGTYECKRIGRLSPSEYKQCSTKLRDDLCERTVVPSATGEVFNQSTASVRKEYENGTQEISFAFLQCIGFNHNFYGAMRDELKNAGSEHKRPTDNDEVVSRANKKARTEGTRVS